MIGEGVDSYLGGLSLCSRDLPWASMPVLHPNIQQMVVVQGSEGFLWASILLPCTSESPFLYVWIVWMAGESTIVCTECPPEDQITRNLDLQGELVHLNYLWTKRLKTNG